MDTTLFDQRILTDKTVQDTVGYIPGQVVKNARELAIYVLFKSGTSAGVVMVEGAHDDSFTGTWANLATVTWAAENRVHIASITGVHKVIRVRISTTIADGVADVWAVAN